MVKRAGETLAPESWRYRVQIVDGGVVREVCAVSLAEALRLADRARRTKR